jgi:hypothetical protein
MIGFLQNPALNQGPDNFLLLLLLLLLVGALELPIP